MYKALRREERVGQRLSLTGPSALESRDMERSGEDIKGELEVERPRGSTRKTPIVVVTH